MNDVLFSLSTAFASPLLSQPENREGSGSDQKLDSPAANADCSNDLAGKKAVVIKPVTKGAPGRVRCLGTTWPARSLGECFRIGQEVAIAAQDDTTMIIESWSGTIRQVASAGPTTDLPDRNAYLPRSPRSNT